MADRMHLSGQALAQLEAWLPSDLTEKQLDKVITAAEAMATVIYQEATLATRTITRMRADARNTEKTT